MNTEKVRPLWVLTFLIKINTWGIGILTIPSYNMSIQVVSIGGVSLLHQILLSEDNVSFRYPAENGRRCNSSRWSAPWSMLVLPEPTYTEAMIDVVRDMGPYIVLAPVLLCFMRASENGGLSCRCGFGDVRKSLSILVAQKMILISK